MEHRLLTTSQKREVLDRDGWCCNNCGYVPFHTTKDIPECDRENIHCFRSFVYGIEIRPPVIILKRGITRMEGSLDLICDCELVWLHGGELEFDHIIPVYKGGSFKIDNCQALCRNCHNIKSYLDYIGSEATKYVLSKYQPVKIGAAL